MSVNLFDAKYYSIANPDLALAGLTTSEQLFDHFQKFGLEEGRKFSAFVDLNFYKQNNSDLGAAGLTTNRQVYEHLQNLGVTERRQFSPWLDLEFYLAKNPDVQQFYGNDRAGAFEHLQNLGINEKRQFSPLLNLNYYLAANPDVGQAFADDALKALEHLERTGIFEERLFSFNFDPDYYRNIYPDLAAANLNDLQLLQHFASHGLREGRRSSEKFDINYYWENNPDLKAAGLNYQQAFQHAYLHGWQEGRPSSPGHTVGEPVIIWKRTADGGSGGRYNFSDLNLDSMGNIRIFGGIDSSNRLSSIRPSIPLNKEVTYSSNRLYSIVPPIPVNRGVAFRFYDPSSSQFLRNEYISMDFPVNISKIVFDNADNIYITKNALTSKYDSNGNLLWDKRLGENSFDYNNDYIINAKSIAVDGAGNAYVVGNAQILGSSERDAERDALLAKYSTNGDRLWIKQIETSENDSAVGVTTDNAGNIYVLGDSGTQGWLSKHDSLTGDRNWIKQIDLQIGSVSPPLVIADVNNLYVAGRVGDIEDTDIFIAKYDSLTGNQQWLQKLGSEINEFLGDLDMDNAGNVYLGSNYSNYKFDSNGIQQSFLPASNRDTFSFKFRKMTLDNSENIYILSDYNLIEKYSPIAEFL